MNALSLPYHSHSLLYRLGLAKSSSLILCIFCLAASCQNSRTYCHVQVQRALLIEKKHPIRFPTDLNDECTVHPLIYGRPRRWRGGHIRIIGHVTFPATCGNIQRPDFLFFFCKRHKGLWKNQRVHGVVE